MGDMLGSLAEWKARTTDEIDPLFGEYAEAEDIAGFFKLLSDPTRVRVIEALILNNETRVRDLANAVGMSQPSVSHHLRILRHLQLVKTRRKGKEIYYSPSDGRLESLLMICLERIASTS
jgi:DNA-binding transcriptional ArsR family regulator